MIPTKELAASDQWLWERPLLLTGSGSKSQCQFHMALHLCFLYPCIWTLADVSNDASSKQPDAKMPACGAEEMLMQ